MAKRKPMIGQITFRLSPESHYDLIDIADCLGSDTSDLIKQMIAFAKPTFRRRADATRALNEAALLEGSIRNLAGWLALPGRPISPGTAAQTRAELGQLRNRLTHLNEEVRAVTAGGGLDEQMLVRLEELLRAAEGESQRHGAKATDEIAPPGSTDRAAQPKGMKSKKRSSPG
jgi:hypothetical protein